MRCSCCSPGLSGATAGGDAIAGPFIWAAQALAQSWPFAIAGAILWFGIAYAFYQNIIDAATGAKPVERKAEPKLYNLLENLCISRGITMPALRIMETDGAERVRDRAAQGQYSVTVTRGLMNTLNDEELEAVLAHELTHIRNADVRLLIIAVIFVGIFSFVGEMAFRWLALWRLRRRLVSRSSSSRRQSRLRRRRDHRDHRGAGDHRASPMRWRSSSALRCRGGANIWRTPARLS